MVITQTQIILLMYVLFSAGAAFIVAIAWLSELELVLKILFTIFVIGISIDTNFQAKRI